VEFETVIKKNQNPFRESAEADESNPDESGLADSNIEIEVSEGDLQKAQDDLIAAQQEVAQLRDAMLRIQAESDNTRKRLARDAEKSRRFALERVMKDLLQVVDSMERGLQTDMESATVASLLEGQELTLKMLTKVLTDHNLELVDPTGEPFNPEFHEAVTMLPSPDHDEGSVMEVLQKGYKLHDRLVRPAMVVVSGKP
jgi:molecular chaperone GrpE